MQAAGAFELSAKAVSNAKDDDSPNKNFSNLSLPKVERDKMYLLRPLLGEYFSTIEPVSGVCFTFTSLFSSYVSRPDESYLPWHSSRLLFGLSAILPEEESHV